MRRAPDRARFGWQLLSLLLAYLLWLAVIDEKQAFRHIEVPLRFENLSAGLAMLRDRPSSVIVRVKGTEPLIKEVQSPDVEAVADLSGRGEGKHLLRLWPDAAHAIVVRKDGIEVDEVFPAAIAFVLERKASAELPVRPVLGGSVAAGFELGEVRVEPRRVRVEGPESAAKRLVDAPTREILVEGREESFTVEVPLDITDPDVRILGRPLVRVAVTIQELRGEATFDQVRIRSVGSDYEAQIRPLETTVTVEGPRHLLDRLAADDVRAYVDLRGLAPQPKPYELRVQVDFAPAQVRDRLQVKSLSAAEAVVRILDRRADGEGG
jgi:YbbR domain-containing protein